MSARQVFDVSHLPTFGFGPQSPMWWGTVGFVAIEGTGFALAAGMYLYLVHVGVQWPNGAPPPNPLPGTIVTALLIASVVPNMLASRWAKEQDLLKTRIVMAVMSVAGIAPLIVRWFEFPALNVRWDVTAYGSIVWLLLGLHTTHLLTDVGDTIVLTVLMLTKHGTVGRRFSDVSDNATYWNFVVISWLPIYFLLYWAPSFLR
jgi:cytochrome c oxidase subunit 3